MNIKNVTKSFTATIATCTPIVIAAAYFGATLETNFMIGLVSGSVASSLYMNRWPAFA